MEFDHFCLRRTTRAGSSLHFHSGIFNDVQYHVENGNDQVVVVVVVTHPPCSQVYLYSFDYRREQDNPWWKAVGTYFGLELKYIEDLSFIKFAQFPYDQGDDAKVGEKYVLTFGSRLYITIHHYTTFCLKFRYLVRIHLI